MFYKIFIEVKGIENAGSCSDENQRIMYREEMRISQLAYVAGMPPSTLKNIMKGNSRNTGIVTIKMICDGLNISLDEFFHCGLFQDLEQEID